MARLKKPISTALDPSVIARLKKWTEKNDHGIGWVIERLLIRWLNRGAKVEELKG